MGRKAIRDGKTKGAKLLYDWIQGRGLTYETAGDLLGFPKERVSRYINGRCTPDSSTMHRIFMITGIEMSAWFKGGPRR